MQEARRKEATNHKLGDKIHLVLQVLREQARCVNDYGHIHFNSGLEEPYDALFYQHNLTRMSMKLRASSLTAMLRLVIALWRKINHCSGKDDSVQMHRASSSNDATETPCPVLSPNAGRLHPPDSLCMKPDLP